MIGPRQRVALFVLSVVLITTAQTAQAYFERVLTSSRVAANGGAFVSVANDAAAAWHNPAGMTNLYRYDAVASFDRPYGVDDVSEAFAAAAYKFSEGAFGVAWSFRGVDHVLTENRVTLSYARDLRRTSEDASLSVAVFTDLMRVSAQDGFNSSDGAATVGLSILIRPFPVIGAGYTVRNLNEATIHLIDGGPGTDLRRTHAWGLSYFWEQRLIVGFEWQQDATGVWQSHGGVDFRLQDRLMLRGGMDGRYATAGFGVEISGARVDVGIRSHDVLGATYLFSLGFGAPRPVNSYAVQ